MHVWQTMAQAQVGQANISQIQAQAMQALTVATHGATCLRAHEAMTSWTAWIKSWFGHENIGALAWRSMNCHEFFTASAAKIEGVEG